MTLSDDPLSLDGQISPNIRVSYTNYRGETATRLLRPIELRYGASEWHSEPQWFMLAEDMERKLDREFALKDMVLLEIL